MSLPPQNSPILSRWMASTRITSAANPKFKWLKSLRERKKRDLHKRILVEGIRECERAIKAGFRLSELVLCESLLSQTPQPDDDLELGGDEPTQKGWSTLLSAAAKEPAKIATFVFAEHLYRRVTLREQTEPVLAVFHQQELELPQAKELENPLFVILDRLEKPGNLGAIARTCDAVGVDGILCVGKQSVDPWNPNVIRTSLGTVFGLPIVSLPDAKAAVNLLAPWKLQLVAAEGKFDSSPDVFQIDYRRPTAILLGSEALGVDKDWQDHIDTSAKIPMNGLADSLNVSVACAVFLYEALRQRTKNANRRD